MICSNCGADIGDNETACPYCGAMQYENSEQKYMKDLYNLNEGMKEWRSWIRIPENTS